GEKNDEMKFATGLNCSVNPQSAYDEFRRSFEYYAKERFFKSDLNFQNFNSDEKTKSKEKVRIHHYVQSFDPKENVSPEEAHKIGIEWAKKTFGENMQVIVSTHLDKGHIHNHFAVCPYDLNGKRWIDNMNTLKRARKISDEIALEHGLHIIESPKHKNTMKYSEWLAKQNGVSWKNQLAADIDKLILREDVQSVSDLADKMKEQGYTVRSGKYLSVKAPKQKNAIRSFRLGDGYSVDDLQYRILHKEREISLTAIQSYSGVQREYAFCMRQMQIAVFTKKPKRATYSDLRKSTELLNFLTENNITSADELENRLNAAAEKEEYKKVSYIEKMSIGNSDDIEQRRQNVEKLKSELADIDVTLEKQKEERNYVAELFKVYKRDIENNPYEEYQRQLEAEQQEQQA
ncbi:MAG: relaxase/mobilization nuclease domain-containing protein, partial [Muribaculaceae bacterium]|nr:relaxase/mobilization nuclease domain-containing protein [Muribaculaceae bacterium]